MALMLLRAWFRDPRGAGPMVAAVPPDSGT
jgi:hypothetical protein